ncbi:hypothetical protein BGX21_001917 [Mortierella sp. AD011]|nr:hypothetical protein BGX21_001917 [Mortierella sp. AD011]
MWLGVAVLIRDTSTLTTVDLSPNRCVLANRVWNSIEDNSTVTALRLGNLDVNYERQARIFWRACTTLETLEMEHCFVYSRRRSNGCVPDSFPRMKEIKFQDLRLRSGNLIHTMANSPQLLSFFWRGGRGQEWFRLREIHNGLEATTGFLSLESLDLSSSNLADIDISQIIRGMKKPIVKLGLVKTGAGSLTIAALGPHLRTIQGLDFRGCYQVKSYDIIVFLRSCPDLISFKAGTLDASDMEEDERWACANNLRVLCVHIRVSLDEDESRYVFTCLSKLILLQEFDIARYRYTFLSVDDIIKRPLQLRLNCGLGQLSTLSRMERLSIGTDGQAMTMDEGLWIKKHWRRLKTIQGRFNADNRPQKSLRKLFREEAKPNPTGVVS